MNYTQSLSTEQLQRFVPSAFAEQAYHAQSDRYAFIPTSKVIEGMGRAGFMPVNAVQSRTRIEDKRGFTKHMIRFRSSLETAVVGNSVLEAVLINSHDGSSAYNLICGVYRFVCANGMCVADSMLESIHIRHTGRVIEDVIEGTTRLFEQAPRVLDAIGEWQGIELAQPEQLALAEAAHSLRFPVDAETGKASTPVTPAMLLDARRAEDRKPDLWSTFNRVQENATKGFKTYANHHRVTVRAVKGIDGDVKLNRALWTLAEKMAEIKRAA